MPSSYTAIESGQDIPLEELELFNIFQGLSQEKLEELREIIEVVRFDTDEPVIRDGEVGDTFYLLLEGEVEVTKTLVMRMSRQEVDQTDKSLIRLRSEPHPEFGKPAFGEMALFSAKSKRTATVTPVRPSILGVIQRDPFFKLCEADMEIGYRVSSNIACVLIDRLDKANEDVMNLTTALSFVLAAH